MSRTKSSNVEIFRKYQTNELREHLGRLKAQREHGGTYDKPCGGGVCLEGQTRRYGTTI